METKSEQNQHFKSIGVLSTLLLLFVCALALAPVWNGAESQRSQKTMHRAESLAYQVLEAQKVSQEGSQKGGGRGPASEESSLSALAASEGSLGQDEWGQPYRFQVLNRNNGLRTVLVWSAGPNGILDSDITSVSDSNHEPTKEVFQNDDLGVVVSVR